MAFAILIVIYLAFISLGLPDSVLGIIWPEMRKEILQPVEALSGVTLVIVAFTSLSAFISGRIIRKIGTGPLTFFCGAMTGLGLIAISYIHSYPALILVAVPLGAGAGAVDAALNNYVSEHYQPRYMNWLHSFWGLGAIAAPLLVTALITSGSSWRFAARTIAAVQLGISLILFFALPAWRKQERVAAVAAAHTPRDSILHSLRVKGVWASMLLFFLYCGVEYSMINWAASYMLEHKRIGLTYAGAAQSLLFAGLTAGRILAGFVVGRTGNRKLVYAGMSIALIGAALLAVAKKPIFCVSCAALIGLGYAPIYPCMMHESAARFPGSANKDITGYQVAAAGLGVAVIPVSLGYASKWLTLSIMPAGVIALLAVSLLIFRRLNQIT